MSIRYQVEHEFHTMCYDADGVYCGQTQLDVDGEGEILIRPDIIDGLPCVNGEPIPNLTPEEMKALD